MTTSTPSVLLIVLTTDFCTGVTNPLLQMRTLRHEDILKLAQGLATGKDSNLVGGSPRDHAWDHSAHHPRPNEMTRLLDGPWRGLPPSTSVTRREMSWFQLYCLPAV